MVRDPAAIPVGGRSRLAMAVATALGAVAFCWPFVVAPGRFGDAAMAPILFGVLLLVVVMVVVAEVADGGIDAKAVAMLGVLAAIGAALRPLGAGTAGIETVFVVLILAGRVFGPGFGFVLGCTTLFASALVTGGVGPWMPYQMFGCAWVGMLAGLLPAARGRREIVMLVAYGVLAGYLFGFLANLSFWPFTVDPHSTVSYVPGASFVVNVRRYLAFDVTTSLGWDTGRAVTNAVLLTALGPVLLATFRRASRRAAFDAPVVFDGEGDRPAGRGEPASAT
jgi:energy-coupling factor transport system substrate-specific component